MPISINNTTLTFNNGTTMTTAATGTVSSVATGNGLTGGTITTSGTISIAPPTYQSVGSYLGLQNDANTAMTPNSNYSGNVCIIRGFTSSSVTNLGAATGTWRMSSATAGDWFYLGLRVA